MRDVSCNGSNAENEGERMSWKVRAYYNVNPFIGVCPHDTMVTVPLPPFMLPGKLPHIDFSVVQGLWLGSFLSNGRDRVVLSDDLLFVGRMSDAGFVLPHISIPPSWYNLLTTLFGGSNALFGVGSVQLACKNLLWGNEDCDLATTPFPIAPVSLNLQCGDPFSVPSDVVVVWGSVYAGMSLSDIYAALIDLAIQWAMEGAMLLGGFLLKKGIGKLAKKLGGKGSKAGTGVAKRAGRAAVKKQAKTGAKTVGGKIAQGFSNLGTSIVNGVKKASGVTASEAYKAYLEKAAKMKAIKEVIGMSDDELATFVRRTGGFSDNMSTVAKQFTEGYDSYAKKYSKQVNIKGIYRDAAEDAAEEIDQLKKLDYSVDDVTAKAVVSNTTLKEALQALDTAVAKVASEEVLWQVELKLAMKSFSKVVSGHLIRGGNLLGSGTSGGVFSFEGLGWTNYFQRTLRYQDKWYADITGSSTAADQAEEIQEGAGIATSDDDYWYTEATTTESSTETDSDDYWYGEPTMG